MVSTRGPKHKFAEGEKVLCYEPDPTKAKVLYDSKVLGSYESKDNYGRKLLQYKIHFQGWSSSWDRKVNSDFVLKDTEENRQLQKDLAERAQLQLGAYLYRRDAKKRIRKEEEPESSLKVSNPGSSENNLSSGSAFEKNEADFLMRDEIETESCSSSESYPDEDRVVIRVSNKLRNLLNYDYDMVLRKRRQHILPACVPALSILEDFFKESALRLVLLTMHTESTRRRNPNLRPEKKEREFEKVANTVSLLKETADGLRIYLDHVLISNLIYNDEKEYTLTLLTEENLETYNYVPLPSLSSDFFSLKTEADTSTKQDKTDVQQNSKPITSSNDVIHESLLSETSTVSLAGTTRVQRSAALSSLNYYKSIQPMVANLSKKTKDFLQKEILSWQILPRNTTPTLSMIFGATHLARLIVKMPDFLNATRMPDEKLKVLLKHLDSFTRYLEARHEWFGEHNYKDSELDPEDDCDVSVD